MSNYRDGKQRYRKIKTAEIRQSFLDYFKKNDHRIVPSSPVIPFNDPTLLFTNAGMNQFKDVFTGQCKVEYKRAASAQKCIRAGGKHNDLDNVGFTAQHHTFFEMLGNFSFGDYFKEQAIYYAWEWVTKELALPVDRLYATVYETDDEAFDLWEKIAPQLKEGRLLRFGKKDNYWAMGDTGPCGPCSEIHFDRGEKFGAGLDDIINGDTDRFVEIWNLVFMQYDQQPDGSIIDLPKPSVDTGAGLERIAAIMQGVDSNYEIDIFKSIIDAISDITKSNYKDNVASHHIIADHLRALTFAIADGAGISNEGQGYVLRRILRRAARHGRLLGMHEPFIYRVVPVLVSEMGNAYPEIKEKQDHIERVIKAEEEAFDRTLATGLELLDRVMDMITGVGDTIIPGEEVFRLYDTYGFPYDLTEVIAAEKGLTLDRLGYEKAMEAQQTRSRSVSDFSSEAAAATKKMIDILESIGMPESPTGFISGETEPVLEIMTQTLAVSEFVSADNVFSGAVILRETPFYVESGGQIDDTGVIESESTRLRVTRLSTYRDLVIHIGYFEKGYARDFGKGTKVAARVDAERRWDIMRNHTATHLTQAALRQVLGQHIKQSGSYVGPDRLRFDFSHHQPMTPDEIEQVEKIVNGEILKGSKVDTKEMDVESAQKSGAMALFGEKYGDMVRVVSVGDFSKELCGGTHVDNVSQIGPFFITLETGVASGVRRLEAITGREAIRYMLDAKQFRRDVASMIGRTEADALDGVRQLRESSLALQKEIRKLKAEMFSGAGQSVGEESTAGDVSVITHDFGRTDAEIMCGWIDAQKACHEAVVAFGLGIVNGKVTYMASASHAAVTRQHINVGKLSKQMLPQFGGRGGGKSSFAQGTVALGTVSQELFEAARSLVKREAGEQ